MPLEANSLYLKDEIGNISTSHAIRDWRAGLTRLTLQPRFMVMGQWAFNCEVGYNLPLSKYLQVNQD